ncbi:MAG: beta-hydroxyacyl-ACP dehydratase [Planctomycetes bacterium]|nr:beta-hydroxyacyl-ACP dehydratase [Planctomycetota bacterium]
MPAQPIVDLKSLDLSRVVVDSAGVRKHCMQRNRFALLDGVLAIDPKGEWIVGYKDLAREDWWAADHIPGRPIFPGVLQLEGAAQLATYHFMTTVPNVSDKFVGFGGVDKTRFRAVVTPPSRLVLVAKSVRVRPSMFTYLAQGFVDDKLVMETEILGVIV